MSGSRPVRPVERQGMRDWLTEKLDSKAFDGLEWVDRQSGKFKIKWYHGSRHGWTQKETLVFEAWAKHTGKVFMYYFPL